MTDTLEIKSAQSYARVNSANEVPDQVGGLKLDYERDAPVSRGVAKVRKEQL